jgi:hypothetical protein
MYTFPGKVASVENNYLAHLIQQLKFKKLHQQAEWILVMRYQKTLTGWKSEVDNRNYFFHREGKHDPEKELEANLIAFFDEIEYPNEDIKMHPQCAFPARFSFIKKHLDLNPEKMKYQSCNKLRVWKDALTPESLSIVFASYYLGSPASIMGHTLFKMNSKQNKNKELLDYGVNYAAITNEKNPIRYIWNGLTGGYSGIFSIYPYYTKVNEYNDLETRDLWEYELNLNDIELDRFLNHLWELLWQAEFDYFFFDENCAYHMYALIEYSRLGIKLRDRFNLVVNPPDAIKNYLSQKDLVKAVKFRPSLFSTIQKKIEIMNEKEKELFFNIWQEKREIQTFSNLNFRKDLILDTLLDSYRWKKMRENESEIDKKLYRNYLLERSVIEEDTYSILEKEYKAYSPENSHNFSRISVSHGNSSLGTFQEIKYRIGYHDLLNSEKGFMPNSEVILGDISIRLLNKNQLIIDKFVLGSLSSFTPENKLSNPVSYKIDISFDSVMKKSDTNSIDRDLSILSRMDLKDTTTSLGTISYFQKILKESEAYKIHPFQLEALFGKSYSFQGTSNFLISFLSGPKLQFHSDFINGYRWAPALFMNLTYEYKNLKFGYMGGYYHYILSNNQNDFLSNLKIRYSLTDNREVRLDFLKQQYYTESSLGIHFLF